MSAPEVPLTSGAVDLDQVKRANEAQSDLSLVQEREEAVASITEHDRRMQRIFKGIVSRPERRRLMTQALSRMAEDYEPRERQYRLRDQAPRKRRGPGGGGKRKAGSSA